MLYLSHILLLHYNAILAITIIIIQYSYASPTCALLPLLPLPMLLLLLLMLLIIASRKKMLTLQDPHCAATTELYKCVPAAAIQACTHVALKACCYHGCLVFSCFGVHHPVWSIPAQCNVKKESQRERASERDRERERAREGGR